MLKQGKLPPSPGVLRVAEPLDFEVVRSYHLSVRSLDVVSGKAAVVAVAVTVLDTNDQRPRFGQPFYNVSVSEATAIATPVLTGENLLRILYLKLIDK